MSGDWQGALWAIVNGAGRWWDIVVGVIALSGAMALFVKLILYHPLDMLVISRVVIGIGLLLAFYSTLNSGWLKISWALLVIGCFMSTVLIVTGWCHRADKSTTAGGDVLRWLGRMARTTFQQERLHDQSPSFLRRRSR